MTEFYRENALWQSSNGTWNLGFFKSFTTGSSASFDPNWDVEYDHDLFSWVSTGHSTQQEAAASWMGVMEHKFTVYPYSKNVEHCHTYDSMASYKSLAFVNS